MRNKIYEMGNIFYKMIILISQIANFLAEKCLIEFVEIEFQLSYSAQILFRIISQNIRLL